MDVFTFIFEDSYYTERYDLGQDWHDCYGLNYYCAEHGGIVEVHRWRKSHSTYAEMEILYKGEPIMIEPTESDYEYSDSFFDFSDNHSQENDSFIIEDPIIPDGDLPF